MPFANDLISTVSISLVGPLAGFCISLLRSPLKTVGIGRSYPETGSLVSKALCMYQSHGDCCPDIFGGRLFSHMTERFTRENYLALRSAWNSALDKLVCPSMILL